MRRFPPPQTSACIATCVLSLILLLTGSATRGRAPSAAASNVLKGEDLSLRDLYVRTVKHSVSGVLLETPRVSPHQGTETVTMPYKPSMRKEGTDWPLYGMTMIGMDRLDNLQMAVEDVLMTGVPGDFVECGVWRGGASIFARALFAAHGASGRKVHLVDSFKGLPTNTTASDDPFWSRMDFLRVSEDQVRANFQRYGLLDDRAVEMHAGYFRYALPVWVAANPGLKLAVLRADGDMYESTMDVLYNLWNHVAPGGWIIIDDYGIPPCKRATDEFRARHGVEDVMTIVNSGAWFRKSTPLQIDLDWYMDFNASRTLDDASR